MSDSLQTQRILVEDKLYILIFYTVKTIFKKIIEHLLTSKARRYLKKNNVQVIAVTGSIGKTSTKEAIYTVLRSQFEVASSQKSFNTPIGMSLAILGEEQSGFSSVQAWFNILKRIYFHPKKAPAKMVLEMGADHPGDIEKLMSIAPPSISVVTAVREVHLAEGQFKDIEAIAHEKETLVRLLSRQGTAILNGDDGRVRPMHTSAKKVMFGVDHPADIMAKDIQATPQKLTFMVTHEHQSEPCEVPVVGAFQVYVCLPAIAVGLSLGMTLRQCADALKHFKLPPGRLNPIDGQNHAHILDGSYNASPSTVLAALDVLHQLSAPRKIAALGTMNELGEQSKGAHLSIGQKAAQVADWLIAVGQEAEVIKEGAQQAGMDSSVIYTFADAREAGDFLKSKLQKDDLILVKGSQNKVRMERLVKEIMKEPQQAAELLCRQGQEWETIG